MEEFQEIGHSGGKITVNFDAQEGVSLGYQHCAPGGMALFQVGVSLDGQKREFWPLRGVGIPSPGSQMMATFVISDKQRLWGRACPGCKSYFRTDAMPAVMQCPYCSHKAANAEFLTANQVQFVENTRKAVLTAIQEQRTLTIDLDKLADDLPENRPAWAYKEERQQNLYVCSKCKVRYDILGEYAGCPACGKRNALEVIKSHLTELETQLEKADAEIQYSEQRKVEWEKLTRCISDFEAFARDIQKMLVLILATPKRRKDIEGLSFQGIIKANDRLQEWFAIDFLNPLPLEDRTFLNRMFHRRHVLTHSGGRVDQEYLDKTQDQTVRLNQQIVVQSKEVRRLLSLLRGCAERLFEGFESIA